MVAHVNLRHRSFRMLLQVDVEGQNINVSKLPKRYKYTS